MLRNKELFSSFALWNLVFAYVSLFYYGLTDNIRGPLYPQIIETFSLTNSKATLFFAVASIMVISGAGFVPRLVQRWGYLRSFRFAVFILVLSQFIYAWAPNFEIMLIASVFLGLAAGFLGVVQNILVLVASPKHLLSRLMSGLHAHYAGSSLFAPWIVAFAATLSPDFRLNFWVTSVLGTLLLASTFFIPKFVEPTRAPERMRLWQYFRPEIFYFSSILGCYVLAELVVSTRLAQFARIKMQSSLAEASSWVGLFFVGLFLGRMVFSFLHFRISHRQQLMLALFLAVLTTASGLWISPWAFFLAGISMGPCYPLVMALLRDHFPEHLEGVTAMCVISTGLFVVGMHLTAGLLTDAYGISWAMGLAPLFCLVTLLLVFGDPYIWPNRKEKSLKVGLADA